MQCMHMSETQNDIHHVRFTDTHKHTHIYAYRQIASFPKLFNMGAGHKNKGKGVSPNYFFQNNVIVTFGGV